MKKLFPGYYEYSEEDKKNIWGKGIFVFDSCVLLNIYYLSSQINTFLDILRVLRKQIKTPYQIALEYHNNMFSKIDTQYQTYQRVDDIVNKLTNEIQNIPDKLCFTKDEKVKIKKDLQNIHEKIKSISDNNYYSTVRDQIASLLENTIESSIPDNVIKEWEKEGEKRYQNHLPPGYKDRNKSNGNQYGDFFIWKSVLEISQRDAKPVIFVTEDKKKDWFYQQNHAHPFLLNEFILTTKQHVLIYSLSDFIKDYGIYRKKSTKSDKIEKLQDIISANAKTIEMADTQGDNSCGGDDSHDGTKNAEQTENENSK